jgi:streptogramin lyase
VLDGLRFANGIVIDEARGQLYFAQTMGDTITAYGVSVETGELSDRRVVAAVTAPDNVELDAQGRLWVASPAHSAIYVIDPESGEVQTAFRSQTETSNAVIAEWDRRSAAREPVLDLFSEDMWAPLPGGVTGVILTPGGRTFYVSGLGDALIKIDPDAAH